MADAVSFVVAGRAMPQGSKTGVVNPRTGRAQVLEGRSSSQRTAIEAWRTDVTAAALAAIGRRSSLRGPVAVSLVFLRARPASTPASHRWRSARPDIDKLTRAVLDALTAAGVYGDDAQVAQLYARKLHTLDDETEGLIVTVRPLDHASGPESFAGHLAAPDTPARPDRGSQHPQHARSGQ